LNKYEVIKSLLDRRLTNKEAGRSLQLSVRQIQRIKKRVFREGVRGVIHGNKGRKPAHALGVGEYVKKPYVIEKLGMAVRKEIDRSA
jgi:hypothetical protein